MDFRIAEKGLQRCTNWLAGKGACTVSKLREFTKREVYRAVQRVLQPWREAVWRVI